MTEYSKEYIEKEGGRLTPKFLFLMKKFHILKNMNPTLIGDSLHKEIFNSDFSNVKNPFIDE